MSVELKYTGNLAPGDELIIDPEDERALLNGVDVSGDIEGFEKVFELPAGASNVEYSDDEGSRTAKVTIKFTERYL